MTAFTDVNCVLYKLSSSSRYHTEPIFDPYKDGSAVGLLYTPPNVGKEMAVNRANEPAVESKLKDVEWRNT